MFFLEVILAIIQSVFMNTNEKAHHPEVFDKLSKQFPTMETTDDRGDFILMCSDGNILAIERKAPNDLLASIADNRLFNQAVTMREFTPYCYVVITGIIEPTTNGMCFVDNQERKWSYSAVWGALSSVQGLGCKIIFCNGEGDFIPCMVRIAAENKQECIIEPVKHGYIFSPQEATLASLPGIGQNKALKYMEMFGTLNNAIKNLCDENQAKNIPNWGKKSANTLKEYFGE